MRDLSNRFPEDRAGSSRRGHGSARRIGWWVAPALTPSGRRFLARVRGRLRDVRAVRCEGHTALPGAEPADPARALTLSRERADAARDYLRSLGLRARYTTVGLGDDHQRAGDSTEAGRAANRYAALTITHG